MTPRLKTVLVLSALALMATLGLVLVGAKQLRYAMEKAPKPTISPSPSPTPASELVLPTPTGNIDDVVDALLTYSLNEQMVLQTEEQDIGLLSLDSQEIGNFTEVYDENEL